MPSQSSDLHTQLTIALAKLAQLTPENALLKSENETLKLQVAKLKEENQALKRQLDSFHNSRPPPKVNQGPRRDRR